MKILPVACMAGVLALAQRASAQPETTPASQPSSEAAATEAAASQAAPASAPAIRLTLAQLIAMAQEGNPQIASAKVQHRASEEQKTQAAHAWWPTLDVNAFAGPGPSVRCSPSPADCAQTNISSASFALGVGGLFTRLEARLTAPLYTFGKLGAARDLASHGEAAGALKVSASEDDVALNTRRAYYALKLARESLAMLDEGKGYLDQGQEKVRADLEAQNGQSTETDKLRLEVVASDLAGRTADAHEAETMALATLRTLLGGAAPASFDVDEDELAPVFVPDRALADYEELARRQRPELGLLREAVAARSAAANLARASIFPDLGIAGFFAAAQAQGVDIPQNAFYNNPFNQVVFGLGLVLHFNVNYGTSVPGFFKARLDALSAQEDEAAGTAGIALEVERAYRDLADARTRMESGKKGSRAAHGWLVAAAQNQQAGLATARDLSDGLVAYFQSRFKYLQAIYDYDLDAAALSRAVGADVTAPPPADDAGASE